jgi:hypothetical protein
MSLHSRKNYFLLFGSYVYASLFLFLDLARLMLLYTSRIMPSPRYGIWTELLYIGSSSASRARRGQARRLTWTDVQPWTVSGGCAKHCTRGNTRLRSEALYCKRILSSHYRVKEGKLKRLEEEGRSMVIAWVLRFNCVRKWNWGLYFYSLLEWHFLICKLRQPRGSRTYFMRAPKNGRCTTSN